MDVAAVVRDGGVRVGEEGEGALEVFRGGAAEGEGGAEEALRGLFAAEEAEGVVRGWVGVGWEAGCVGGWGGGLFCGGGREGCCGGGGLEWTFWGRVGWGGGDVVGGGQGWDGGCAVHCVVRCLIHGSVSGRRGRRRVVFAWLEAFEELDHGELDHGGFCFAGGRVKRDLSGLK